MVAAHRTPVVIADAMREVGKAARSFEGRWTYGSLRMVDPELAELLQAQRGLWEEALVAGQAADIKEQTAAMVRGWAAVTKRMEGQEPCAYVIGQCPNSGLRVAVTTHLAVAEHLEPDVVLVTPDEVAMLLASQREILKVKQLFPGATVEEIAMRQDQP